MNKHPILDKVDIPKDLRGLCAEQLIELSDELRMFVQETTETKAGHIKSSLGVVELTIALHKVFETPKDILVWDVGHQAYVHKVICNRKKLFSTNRKYGGISGFTKREESEYDPFGAGHSSTSISAAVGFAEAAKLTDKPRKHIAVIGDGAFTGGESFEALNYLGERGLDVLVVLNNNESSIDDNVGGLAKFGNYEKYCQSLGIEYCGEVDGHDLEALLSRFEELKTQTGPRLLKVNTIKGRGWKRSVQASSSNKTSFQSVFAETLVELASKNPKIVAISPAMLAGSGLSLFKEKFPNRTFDVGIAEQHAVTMAAALSADGFIPVCHLYSTFSQRALDQIIHDVALQKLPVVFALDRAGLVGEDGATHHGSFDVSLLSGIPNIELSAPLNGSDLKILLEEAIDKKGISVIRYPKGNTNTELSYPSEALRCIKKGKKVAVISFGAIGSEVIQSTEELDVSHYNVVQLKPFPEKDVEWLLNQYDHVISVEENTMAGGLGSILTHLKVKTNCIANLYSISLPDRFVEHGSRKELLEEIKMDAKSIRLKIESLL